MGGQVAQATPLATPVTASRTASLARNISVGRPPSAAPSATRKATVTFSGSSSPVVRLITAFPGMASSPLLQADDVWLGDESRAEQVHGADVLATSREDVLLHQAGWPGWAASREDHAPAHVQARTDFADRAVSQCDTVRPA